MCNEIHWMHFWISNHNAMIFIIDVLPFKCSCLFWWKSNSQQQRNCKYFVKLQYILSFERQIHCLDHKHHNLCFGKVPRSNLSSRVLLKATMVGVQIWTSNLHLLYWSVIWRYSQWPEHFLTQKENMLYNNYWFMQQGSAFEWELKIPHLDWDTNLRFQ